MAGGLRAKFAGVTAEQLDKLEAAHNARNHVPAGLIFHASGPVEDGWGVLDFWESREEFDSSSPTGSVPRLPGPASR